MDSRSLYVTLTLSCTRTYGVHVSDIRKFKGFHAFLHAASLLFHADSSWRRLCRILKLPWSATSDINDEARSVSKSHHALEDTQSQLSLEGCWYTNHRTPWWFWSLEQIGNDFMSTKMCSSDKVDTACMPVQAETHVNDRCDGQQVRRQDHVLQVLLSLQIVKYTRIQSSWQCASLIHYQWYHGLLLNVIKWCDWQIINVMKW